MKLQITMLCYLKGESQNDYSRWHLCQSDVSTFCRSSKNWGRTGKNFLVRKTLILRNVGRHIRLDKQREQIATLNVLALESFQHYFGLDLLAPKEKASVAGNIVAVLQVGCL